MLYTIGLDGRGAWNAEGPARTVATGAWCWCMATPETACLNSASISSKLISLSLDGEISRESSSSDDGIMGLAVPLAGTGATRRGPPALLVDGVGAPKAAERLPAMVVVSMLPQLVRRVFHEVEELGAALPRPLLAFLRLGDLARAKGGEMARAIRPPGRDDGPTMGGLCARVGHRLSSLRSSAQSPSGMTWHLWSKATCLVLVGDAVREMLIGASDMLTFGLSSLVSRTTRLGDGQRSRVCKSRCGCSDPARDAYVDVDLAS